MAEKGFGVRLTANVDSYVSGMAKARASTEQMASTSAANMAKVGGQMQKVGGQLSRAVTLPIAGVGIAAIKMSSDFESSFAKMQGLAGVTADEVDGLKASVLELAGRTAQAPQQLAEALYAASSSGLDTAQAMAAVEVAAKGAAAGMGTSADIVGLVASATASYGAANIDAARATDILTAAIREGRADPAELAGTLGRVLPIANAVGISFEEVGGATAYLSNIMGDTNRSVTSLQGLLVKLASPTKQGRQALLDMGTSVEELKAAIDQDGLLGALELLRVHGFEGNAQAMTQLFDDIEGRQGALALLADESGTLAATMDKVANSAGSLDTAFTIAADTSGFKMKQAWTDIQVALIEAGDVIMPIVSGIVGGIGDLAGKFSELSAPVKLIVVAFLAFAAAAGPVLMISGSLIKNFKEVKLALSGMNVSANVAAGALGAVGIVMIAATAWYADNQAKKQRLVQTTNDFVDALNAERDGQQGAVDAAIAKGLSDQKLIDNAAKLGLKVKDLAAIVNGDVVPAYAELQKQVNDADLNIFSDEEKFKAFEFVNDKLSVLNDGLENANVQTAAAAAVQRELQIQFGLTTTSMVEHGGAAADVAVAADEVALSEEEMADALQVATDALDRQVEALQADLAAQEALIEFARRAADAQYALAASTDDYDRFLEELPGKLDEINKSKDSEAEKVRQTNALYREGSQAASQLADDVVTAYDEAADGATTAKEKGDLFRQSMLNSALAASGPVRQSILDYVLAVNEVPAEKQTAIIAAVEAGDLATAIALLDGASATREAEVLADLDEKKLAETQGKLDNLEDPLHATLVVDADISGATGKIKLLQGAGKFYASAGGRYVDHPMISTLGEGGKPEVVLPLTNQGRLADLLSDRRVSGPILNAFGGGVKSAGGRTVNLTHTSIPAATATASSVTASTLTGTFEDAQAAQDELMERMWRRDALSYEAYRDYLSKRKEGLKEYSDEEQDLFDRIQQLDQNQVKQREEDARITTESADKIQKYLYETNQISLADYMAYLAGRRGSYQAYTDEWFALSYQIISVQEQMDRAAAEATDAVFRQADAVKSLADATQANQDAAGAFYAAGAHAMEVASTRGATDEEKQSALDAYNQSAVNLAQTAYNLADALANERGFTDGSIEWARFMRQRLTADSVWNHANGRENVANAVDRLLAGIPAFAGGGYVPATPGGKIVRVAEGGQGEYMVPANRMHAMAGGGTSVYAPVYHISINGAVDRPGVARELREILDEDNRRNGRR